MICKTFDEWLLQSEMQHTTYAQVFYANPQNCCFAALNSAFEIFVGTVVGTVVGTLVFYHRNRCFNIKKVIIN